MGRPAGKNKVRLWVMIPADLLEKVEIRAKKERRNRNQMAVIMLEDAMEEYEKITHHPIL